MYEHEENSNSFFKCTTRFLLTWSKEWSLRLQSKSMEG